MKAEMVAPGAIAFTRMPRSPTSVESVAVRLRHACLGDGGVGTVDRSRQSIAPEETLMMLPLPRAAIAGIAA
ncbi:MAG: hypothetical protein R3E53_05755 [Myxococcota bacterium]